MGETEPRPGRGHFSEEDWRDFAREQAVDAGMTGRELWPNAPGQDPVESCDSAGVDWTPSP